MNNRYFNFKQSSNKAKCERIEPYLSANDHDTTVDQSTLKKPIDDEQFVEALDRCLRKSLYDDYSYLPRWALWS